jgi:transketolase
MAFVGMTTFGTSGRWDQLLEHFGLAPSRIAAEARELVARKRA